MAQIDEATFKHEPLPPGRNIRILVLVPSQDFDSDIQCRLIQPSLDEARGGYDALSYVWGSRTRSLEIICNDKPFLVTKNCLLALRYLRDPKETRFLWIDAICIDQMSDTERGHQVELMGEIYKFANNVIIWLGEEQPGTRRAFRRAHNYHRLTRIVKKAEILIKGRELPPAFLPLLKHDWFQRIWTFQELLMASRPIVQCGHCSLPWEAFVARVDPWVPNLARNVWNANMARFLWQVQARVTDSLSSANPKDHGERSCYETSNSTLAGEADWLVIVLLLWQSTQQRFSSEPLDRFYGLYGLLRSMGFGLPRPDYHKSGPQVAQEMTFSSLMSSRSLTPLYCFVQQRFSSDGPSWAIHWEHFDDNETMPVRCWGIKEGNHHTFRHDFRPTFEDNRLGLEGILYGTLQPFGSPVFHKKGDSFSGGDIPLKLTNLTWLREMLNLTKTFQTCPNGQLPWEALFIAYFKGYHIDGSSRSILKGLTIILLLCGMASSQLPRHSDLVKESARGPPLKQIHMLNEDELHVYVRDDPNMQEFTKYLTETARNCQDGILFRTSQGWIGLSMCPFQPSDQLALLHGSTVPAILRPVRDYYQLIGFASVQGIQDSAWPIRGDEDGVQRIVLI